MVIELGWSRRERILAGVVGVVITLFVASLFWNNKTDDPMEKALKTYDCKEAGSSSKTEDGDSKKSKELLWVDVKGAVHKPGLYKLKPNTRVFEAVQKAGGTVADADTNQINLAQVLVDGMILYIPKKGEALNQFVGQGIAASSGGIGGKININTATEQELQTLPGIGPSKAQMILQYRSDHGRFTSAEDLKKISGFGEKAIARLKDQIRVG